MRRMGGGSGGGAGGQIFNIGKSKATLFDKESQVSITFNDVAGLEEAKQGCFRFSNIKYLSAGTSSGTATHSAHNEYPEAYQ